MLKTLEEKTAMISRELEQQGYQVKAMTEVDDTQRGLVCLAMGRLLIRDEDVFLSQNPYPDRDFSQDKDAYRKLRHKHQEKIQDRYDENYQQMLEVTKAGQTNVIERREAFIVTKAVDEQRPKLYLDYIPSAKGLGYSEAIERLFVFDDFGRTITGRTIIQLAIQAALNAQLTSRAPIMRGVPDGLFRNYLVSRSNLAVR